MTIPPRPTRQAPSLSSLSEEKMSSLSSFKNAGGWKLNPVKLLWKRTLNEHTRFLTRTTNWILKMFRGSCFNWLKNRQSNSPMPISQPSTLDDNPMIFIPWHYPSNSFFQFVLTNRFIWSPGLVKLSRFANESILLAFGTFFEISQAIVLLDLENSSTGFIRQSFDEDFSIFLFKQIVTKRIRICKLNLLLFNQ